jgi:hypothetical protein
LINFLSTSRESVVVNPLTSVSLAPPPLQPPLIRHHAHRVSISRPSSASIAVGVWLQTRFIATTCCNVCDRMCAQFCIARTSLASPETTNDVPPSLCPPLHRNLRVPRQAGSFRITLPAIPALSSRRPLSSSTGVPSHSTRHP